MNFNDSRRLTDFAHLLSKQDGYAFTWGLTYGEGFCKKCGYPGRGRHHVGDWFSCGFILQYHPDGLTFEKKITTNEH